MRQELTAKQIGKKIRQLRKQSEMTGQAFAEVLGVSRQHLYHLEDGKKQLTLRRLVRLARAFKVDMGDFIGKKSA